MHRIHIRAATVSDAAELHSLNTLVRRETPWLLLEPNEGMDLQAQARALERPAAAHQRILLAFCDGALAGYLGATRGQFNRNRHVATIAMAVAKAYWNLGIGKGLIRSVLSWARESDVRRIELTVCSENSRAIGLYQASGFTVEGIRRGSFRVDGSFRDELYMSRLLPPAGGAI